MKKAFAVLIALTIILTIAGCGADTGEQTLQKETVDFSIPEETTSAPNLPAAVSCVFNDGIVHVTSDEETISSILEILKSFKAVDTPASSGEKVYTLTISYAEADQVIENYGSFFRCGENWYTVSESLNNHLSSFLKGF